VVNTATLFDYFPL